MSRLFGFVGLIIVVAVGAYIFMRQTQSAMTAGTSDPRATVDLIGVKNDLLAMAQAERAHAALHGDYVSLEELRSQGELSMRRESRGPYTYSAEVSPGSFRIVATYSGPQGSGLPRSINIDPSMQISQE
ncbi:MAG TPA: hypothetical protein VIX19_01810 [Terriglobales bacterium]